MSKRLPYFQFEPAEYLAGDIMFCSYGAQGVFNIIQSIYWQKDCCLTLEQAKRRCRGAEDFINELIKENILKIDNGNVVIHFLDDQYNNALENSKSKSVAGKKSATLKKLRKEINARIKFILENSKEDLTEFQQNFNRRSTDVEYLLQHNSTIKIIEDKIRENKEDEVEDKIDNEKFYNVDTLENLYLKNDNIINAVLKNKKLGFKNKEHLVLRLGIFKASLQEVGRNQETFKEFCSYFRNWHLKTKNINPKGNTPFSNITF